jgi:hypothetical protein
MTGDEDIRALHARLRLELSQKPTPERRKQLELAIQANTIAAHSRGLVLVSDTFEDFFAELFQ